MAFPANHKTLFFLDHSPFFANECKVVRFDFHKNRGVAAASGDARCIVKSVWTCVTEAIFEFSRVLYDVFPEDKYLKFFVAGVTGAGGKRTNVAVNAWAREEQSCAAVAERLAHVGKPRAPPGSHTPPGGAALSVAGGIGEALKELCVWTDHQKSGAKGLRDSSDPSIRFLNRGTLVLFTHADTEDDMSKVLGVVQEAIRGMRTQKEGKSNKEMLDQIVLEVINYGQGSINFQSENLKELSPEISYRVTTAKMDGSDLGNVLLAMAMNQFPLASVTVTGIPMKEEQNSSSSADYDVELFHAKDSQTSVLKELEYSQTWKPGAGYKTVRLKWCNPPKDSKADLRNKEIKIHNCTHAARVTPTDVCSRPSSCLTNYLLSGRSVFLEMTKPNGTLVTSHMLTSHGGEIFIHTLTTKKSVLEDSPSILEGPGGRITDYRITDFANLMRANLLAPSWSSEGSPLNKAKNRLSRHTAVCPLTVGSTTIFNMHALETLQAKIVEPHLTAGELAECRQTIMELMGMEAKGEQLPVPVIQQPQSSSSKSNRRKEDQYRTMFNELEAFLRAHCYSDRHVEVLDCLLECRNKPTSGGLEMVGSKLENANVEGGDKRSLDESSNDGFSGQSKRRKTGGSTFGSMTLLDIFKKKADKEVTRYHLPFAGHRNVGEQAKLYLSLETEAK